MKQKLTPLAVGLCMLGLVSVPAFAEGTTDISTRTQALEQQVTELQQELVSLKSELGTKKASSVHSVKKHKRRHGYSNAVSNDNANSNNVATIAHHPQIPGPSTVSENVKTTSYLPIDLYVPGQAFVSSGPYLGTPLEYSGSNLIINSPSVNEDALLLKMRSNINKRFEALGMNSEVSTSHLLLSGFVEGQGIYKDRGIGSSTTNIDLSAANLDAYILGPSTWTSGLMEFAYDNDNGTNEGAYFNNARTQNSRVFVNKAFIIIGDLSKSPVYGSIGQMYVPFGVFSSTMVSSPFTKILGRVQARAVNIGYLQPGPNALYAAGYMFKGDAHGSATGRVNNGGLNLGYRLKQDKFSEDLGAGVIANIADSQTMQNTDFQSASIFGGFGATGTCTNINGVSSACGNERLVRRVPAYDLHGKFSIGDSVDILGEYITTSNSFSSNDLSINLRNAKPQAFHGEAVYSFDTFAHPTSLSAAYDLSKDALALGLPAKRYSVAVNTSIWRNTLESLEVRHDIDYSKNVVSGGSLVAGPQGTGRSDNVVTAQMDLYF